MILLPSPHVNYDIWAFYHDVFSKEECEKLIKSFDFKSAETSALHDDKNQHNDVIRKSIQNWIRPSSLHKELFDRLGAIAFETNSKFWNFQLSGFAEPIQFGHYRQGDYYNWHQDNGGGAVSKRKLSMVVQLSDENDYAGGDLEFILGGKAHRKQGSVIIFPSYQVHRVTPLLRGSRFSLAVWVSGDSYR